MEKDPKAIAEKIVTEGAQPPREGNSAASGDSPYGSFARAMMRAFKEGDEAKLAGLLADYKEL